jgi:hypothetical protein
MPELCAHCGELIDVEHQPHIVIYSDMCAGQLDHIIGFIHIKCEGELEARKNWRRREPLLLAREQ